MHNLESQFKDMNKFAVGNPNQIQYVNKTFSNDFIPRESLPNHSEAWKKSLNASSYLPKKEYTQNQRPFTVIETNKPFHGPQYREHRLRAINGNKTIVPRSNNMKSTESSRKNTESINSEYNFYEKEKIPRNTCLESSFRSNIIIEKEHQNLLRNNSQPLTTTTGSKLQTLLNYKEKDQFVVSNLEKNKELRNSSQRELSINEYIKLPKNEVNHSKSKPIELEKIEKSNHDQSMKIKKLEGELVELKNSLAEWCKKKQSFAGELRQKNDMIEKLERQNFMLRNQLSVIKNQQTQNSEKNIQSQVQIMRQEINKKNEIINRIGEDLKAKQVSLTVSIAQKVKIKEKMLKLQDDNNIYNEQIQNLNTIIEEKVSQLSRLKQRVKTYEIQKIQEERKIKRNSSRQSFQMKQNFEKQLVALRRNIIEKLDEKYDKKTQQLEDKIQQELNGFELAKNELKIKLQGLETQKQCFEQEKQQLSMKNDKESHKLLQKEIQLERKQRQLEQQKKSYESELYNRLKQLNQKEKQLQNQFSVMNEKLKVNMEEEEKNILKKNRHEENRLKSFEIVLKEKQNQLIIKQDILLREYEELKEKITMEGESWKKQETMRLYNERNMLESEFEVTRKQISKWKEEVQKQRESVEKLKKRTEELRISVIEEKEYSINQLEIKKSYLATELSTLNSEISTQIEQRAQLLSKKQRYYSDAQVEVDIADIESEKQIKELTFSIMDLSGKLSQKNKLLFEREYEMERNSQQFEEFKQNSKRQISEFYERKRDLEQNLRSMEEECMTLKAKNKQILAEKDEKQKQIRRIQEDLNLLKLELAESRDQKGQLQELKSKNESELKQLKAMIEIHEKKWDDLTGILKKNQEKVENEKSRCQQVLRLLEDDDNKIQELASQMSNYNKLYWKSLQKMHEENQVLFESKDKNQHKEIIPHHSAIFIQYLSQCLSLALSNQLPESLCLHKIDDLHNKICELANFQQINKRQGNIDELTIPLGCTGDKETNSNHKIKQMQEQYNEILQIFSVNVDALSMATSDRESQLGQFSSRSFLADTCEEKEPTIEEQTNEKEKRLEMAECEKNEAPQYLHIQLKRTDKIHHELLKMINSFIEQFRGLVGKAEFSDRKIQSLEDQNGKIMEQNRKMRENQAHQEGEILRVRQMAGQFEMQLNEQSEKIFRYEEKLSQYQGYFVRTEQMLAEANNQLMKNHAIILSAGLENVEEQN